MTVKKAYAENISLSWKKAYLYALIWVALTCILAIIPPVIVELLDIDMSEPLPVTLLATSYLALIGTPIILLRIGHHTWKVSIAYITELIITSIILSFIGLIAFASLMQGIGPVF